MPPPAATQAAARLWTARPKLHTDPLATKLAECMTPPAGSVRRFTRGRVRELKNCHNSVTVQNRIHVYMNFFHHKDLGNHLLQLCPKVVKHPVFALSPELLCIIEHDHSCLQKSHSSPLEITHLTWIFLSEECEQGIELVSFTKPFLLELFHIPL